MTPFIAKIGPPRVLLGVFALVFGLVGVGFDFMVRGYFDWSKNIQELMALVFAFFNIGQEASKGYFRNRYPIVEMGNEGLFDRRIMKQKMAWEDIEWIDPQPAGLPDRLRVMGRADLTTFGKLRNLFIRLMRRLPAGEIAITFGGLDKAGARATTWLADNRPGLVPDIWKSAPLPSGYKPASGHSAPFISASIYWRAWVGSFVGFVLFFALIAALAPPLLLASPLFKDFRDIGYFVASFGLFGGALAIWSVLIMSVYLVHKNLGNQLIVVSDAGVSDARISADFIPWDKVESVVFEYRDAGRLIAEYRPIVLQLPEGYALSMPASRFLWLREKLRRIATPELLTVRHSGTTTSASEIIETLQRHDIPVALREVARG